MVASALAALAIALTGATATAEAEQGPDVGDTDLLAIACDWATARAQTGGYLVSSCRETQKYPLEISPSGNRAVVVIRMKLAGHRPFEAAVKLQRSLWTVQTIG